MANTNLSMKKSKIVSKAIIDDMQIWKSYCAYDLGNLCYINTYRIYEYIFPLYFKNFSQGKMSTQILTKKINLENNLEGDWPEVVNRLVVKTDQAVEKIDIKSLLECDFSTTTKNSLTASRIVLLDMVKAYFTYKVCLECGIPKVTLEGTLEDWTKLQ